MASSDTFNSSEGAALPVSCEDERHAEPVWLKVSTIDKILDHIVNSRKSGTESLLGFHWQASHVHDLFKQLNARLLELDQPMIRRVEHNYGSKTVFLDIMGESSLHFKVQMGLRDYVKDHIHKLLATANDPNADVVVLGEAERDDGRVDPFWIRVSKETPLGGSTWYTIKGAVCLVGLPDLDDARLPVATENGKDPVKAKMILRDGTELQPLWPAPVEAASTQQSWRACRRGGKLARTPLRDELPELDAAC